MVGRRRLADRHRGVVEDAAFGSGDVHLDAVDGRLIDHAERRRQRELGGSVVAFMVQTPLVTPGGLVGPSPVAT